MSSNTPSHRANSRPIRVFISYAYEDRKWLTELQDHLGALQHMGSIEAFSDTQISTGQEWDPLIKQKLADAEIIILIISARFLGSRYCMSVELAQAIKRHGQASQPSGPHDSLTTLQRRLRDASAKELVSDILLSRWGEADLAGLAQEPDLVKPALEDLASSSAHESDTWRRMLFADLCARMDDPTDTILNIAFERRVSWGDKTGVLPSLRFAREPARQRAKRRLDCYAEDHDMDRKRLAVKGFDFLDCFIHFPDQTRNHSPLDTMSELLDAMAQHGVPEIHSFTFMPRLQRLRPGLAPDLLRHAVQGKHASLLEGVLLALDGRRTPYLADDLYAIADDPDATPQLVGSALMALSSIPGEDTLRLLERAVNDGLPRARSMLLLSASVNRSRAHADLVLHEIDSDSGETTGWTPITTSCSPCGRPAISGVTTLPRSSSHCRRQHACRAHHWRGHTPGSASPRPVSRSRPKSSRRLTTTPHTSSSG